MEKDYKEPFTLDNLFFRSSIGEKREQLDELLHQKLQDAFQRHTSQEILHDITKIASEYSAVDLAYAAAYLSPNVRPVLFGHLPDRKTKRAFLLHTDSATRQKIFRYMRDLEIKQVIETIPSDEAVDLLEDLSQRRFHRVVELLSKSYREKILQLMKHDKNSAARLMSPEFFAFDMDMTIGDVVGYIRNYPRIDFSKGIFLINDQGRLQGFVPGRNLIINSKDLPLRKVMRPIIHKVDPDTSREEVVDLLERYKISFLPVVNDNEKIIGVIGNEDIIEVMEDLSDQTLAAISGTAEKVITNEAVYKRFLARFPWLLVTLVMGLINMKVMSSFSSIE